MGGLFEHHKFRLFSTWLVYACSGLLAGLLLGAGGYFLLSSLGANGAVKKIFFRYFAGGGLAVGIALACDYWHSKS